MGAPIMVFLLFVILARLLGPTAIGLAALAMSAPIIFAVPVTKGIQKQSYSSQHLTDLHLNSAFWLLGTAVGPALPQLFGRPLILSRSLSESPHSLAWCALPASSLWRSRSRRYR